MNNVEGVPLCLGKEEWPWSQGENPRSAQKKLITWPRITVVTPSFNQGRFIEETIRSVLLQGYPNLEYIIIDGGSRDNSVEIIMKYAPHLSYWVSEKDAGQSHAINKGFERATGDVFAWLCSDDVYAPGALLRVGEALSGKKMTLLVGSAILTDGPDNLKGQLDDRKPSFEDMAYNVKTFPQPSVFWTRDLWQKVGGVNESLYFAMDYSLWLRMLGTAALAEFISEVLSYERTQPNQKSFISGGLSGRYLSERAQVACSAALSRNESRLGWLARVWINRFRRIPVWFWPSQFLAAGFHWQAARQVFKTTRICDSKMEPIGECQRPV